MRKPIPLIHGSACVLSLLAMLSACGPVVEKPTRLGSPDYEATLQRTKYTIFPGDELEVRFFHTPELNVTLPVRPDGYISLPYVGEVQAAGRTPESLSEVLEKGYSRELKAPDVTVIVRSFSEQQIHVGGRVEDPGIFPLTGPMTVLDSLFEAGGFQPQARLSEVVVIRRTAKELLVIPVNLETVLDGTDVSQNIQLHAYDAVYVPNSPIADVNTWVDLYIRQNIPFNFGLRVGFVPF